MPIAIICGSVFGNAEDVAQHAVKVLAEQGVQARFMRAANLDELLADAPQALLAVTSTTGMGEIPDNLMGLYLELRERLPAPLRGLPGGIVALGDSAYDDTFCAGGEQLHELFAELGVRELQPMLRLDASETVTPETDAEPWLREFARAFSQT